MRREPSPTPDSPVVIRGKSETLIRDFDDGAFDAVVTDPPYELDFGRMAGRGWDGTGIAFDPGFWAEVLRVLKPGGNLFAFGAPRTYHRLAVAVEDGGFELRDCILGWVSASHFPKTQHPAALLEKIGEPGLAALWKGMGTALKPAHEPVVVARKPLAGPLAENIVDYGVGGLNIDAGRVATDEDLSRRPGTSAVGDIMNFQRAGREKNESHPLGRWPSDTYFSHTRDCADGGECSPDCPVAELERQSPGASRYFPAFHFEGRAPRGERPLVNGVEHISVKPLGVMEWLVGMAARPGQVVLDPFAGSGATVEAAMRLGVRSVAFEAERDYIPLIGFRVDRELARQAAARAGRVHNRV